MVCARCKMVVESEFKKLGLHTISVELGEIELKEELDDKQKEVLLVNLQTLGFDLIDDKKTKTVERIKNLIVDLVHHKNNDLKINLSDYLSENLNQDYNSLSNLFSEIENTTIEKYFISQKIEKVKELLIYNELSLSEIADILNYSNVAHLSNQFKKITGFTPTSFKQSKDKKRIQIENI
ncbi:AraC family transcriptional regulator [Flavobacterium chungangense]|uniref:AraC family transcriptional regulator n=2 Tax=Flavobacterium chungangense TaxID=554283 RepID=A0A6V6Z796_9FLAO|nr:AraC family transcriptional regulator [Flavobacterium chungangense]